jgi:hypothetical protein
VHLQPARDLIKLRSRATLAASLGLFRSVKDRQFIDIRKFNKHRCAS